MRLIIAGTRNLLVDSELIDQLVKFFRLNKVEEVISGGNGNVDDAGEEWSQFFLEKDAKVVKAKWMEEGAAAGPLRNSRMANIGDALLLVWDGKSKGSLNMKKNMEKQGKPIYEVIFKETP